MPPYSPLQVSKEHDSIGVEVTVSDADGLGEYIPLPLVALNPHCFI
jgi:hypothetical protein